jgi:predicted AlkP superfamily pyrophosphatase or phosphodiesterase
MIDWMTEPDGAQHRSGVGSPEAIAALKTTDEQIGLLLAELQKTPAGRATNLIVTADHGFGAEPDPIDLDAAIQGLGDVVVASNGASVLIYAKNHDAAVIRKIAERLQSTDGVDAIFTGALKPEAGAIHCSGKKDLGWVPGTFSLELIGECNPARGADIIVTFQWTSEKNAFGFPGTQRIASRDKRTGVAGRSGHGGLNPWMVHTPLLFWGPVFRKHTTIESPTGNVDIAPTILALEGIRPPESMQGRAITEAFASAKAKPPVRKVHAVRARSGTYCAEVRVSAAGKYQYVDEARRCR